MSKAKPPELFIALDDPVDSQPIEDLLMDNKVMSAFAPVRIALIFRHIAGGERRRLKHFINENNARIAVRLASAIRAFYDDHPITGRTYRGVTIRLMRP